MVTIETAVVTVLAMANLVVIAGSSAILAYVAYRRHLNDSPPGLWRARLDAYREIMNDIIALNRNAVDLLENGQLRVEAEKLSLDQESALDNDYSNVMASFERHYYLIDTDVKDAVDQYVEYIGTYDPNGTDISRVLSLTGNVVRTMREDLDLQSIFPEVETESYAVKTQSSTEEN